MEARRRWFVVVAAAVAMGLALGFVKGDSTGLRAAVGNLSAPWLLIGLYAGFMASTLRRGAAAGLAATGISLVAFYAALTVVLGGHLGGGGALREFATELNANRIYLLFGICTGPVAGAAGCLLRRRSGWTLVAAGMVLAGELAVVAAVHGRELLPRPVYFAWAV